MPPLKGEVPAAQAVGFKNADLGRFNLWRPMVVAKTGGSRWLSALPTGGSNRQSALPTGSRWVQAQPAYSQSIMPLSERKAS